MRLRELGLVPLLCLVPALAAAEEQNTADEERIEALERRVAELEREQAADDASEGSWLAEWARRVRLGGSADVGYFYRDDVTPLDSNAFEAWDSRFFVDAELVEDARWGDVTLVRNAGFSFEWNLVRLGALMNNVGNLYVDFQGIGGSDWVSAQVGRFQVPVGENYLLFGKAYWDKPFISNTVGGPWWWDEGVRVYGGDGSGRFGYVSALINGETPLNRDANVDPMYTLKLFTDPVDWLHVSASGLIGGGIGSDSVPASGALWLGEAWARAFGSGTSVPSYVEGTPIPDGPNELARTWLVAADVIVRPFEGIRAWLAWGRYAIESSGPSQLYDRALTYWIAEVVVEGRTFTPLLAPLYFAARANGLTTHDPDRGYLLDFREASILGYNMTSLNAYSAVLGLRIGEHIVIRGEYSYDDVEVVRGVAPAIRAAAGGVHWFAFDVGVGF